MRRARRRAALTTKKSDPDQFAADYGARRNAFGKCVTRTAKRLAAERKGESAPAT